MKQKQEQNQINERNKMRSMKKWLIKRKGKESCGPLKFLFSTEL